MNLIEKLFRNRFKSKQSLKGIDKDDLWSAITEEMDNDPALVPFYRSGWKKYGLLLLLLMTLSVGGWYFINVNTAKEKDVVINEVADSEKQSKEHTDTKASKDLLNENTSDQLTNSVVENTNLALSSAQNSNVQEVQTSVNQSEVGNEQAVKSVGRVTESKQDSFEEKQKHPAVPVEATAMLNVVAEGARTKTTALNSDKNNEAVGEGEKRKLENKTGVPPVVNEQASARTGITSAFLISSLSQPPFHFLQQHTIKTKRTVPDEEAITPDKRGGKGQRLELGVYAGVNNMVVRYKNDTDVAELAKELGQTTSGQTGFSTALRISYSLNEKYFLTTGVDYDFVQTVFDRTTEKYTQITDANQQLRNAIEIREIVHHNQFEIIAIPLEAGLRRMLGRYEVGAQLGASYNIFIAQKGRLLDGQQNVVNFDAAAQGSVPFKKSFAAYRISAFTSMAIGGGFKLRISPELKYLPQGVSELYGVSQYALIPGIKGGLVYRF